MNHNRKKSFVFILRHVRQNRQSIITCSHLRQKWNEKHLKQKNILDKNETKNILGEKTTLTEALIILIRANERIIKYSEVCSKKRDENFKAQSSFLKVLLSFVLFDSSLMDVLCFNGQAYCCFLKGWWKKGWNKVILDWNVSQSFAVCILSR